MSAVTLLLGGCSPAARSRPFEQTTHVGPKKYDALPNEPAEAAGVLNVTGRPPLYPEGGIDDAHAYFSALRPTEAIGGEFGIVVDEKGVVTKAWLITVSDRAARGFLLEEASTRKYRPYLVDGVPTPWKAKMKYALVVPPWEISFTRRIRNIERMKDPTQRFTNYFATAIEESVKERELACSKARQYGASTRVRTRESRVSRIRCSGRSTPSRQSSVSRWSRCKRSLRSLETTFLATGRKNVCRYRSIRARHGRRS